MSKIRKLGCIFILLLVTSCATSNHATFVASTYHEQNDTVGAKALGKVVGESRQTWVFYIFPIGEAPSTSEAVLDAKSQIEGTLFLADVSIDDTIHWKFGYSEQVVVVEATAYK